MPEYRDEAASITAAFVKSDSEGMWRLCEQFMAALSRADDMDRRMSHVCFEEPVINATCRVANREKMLLSQWESVGEIKKLKAAKLSYALGVVARTTCSIPLGRALLQYGADVNGQKGKLAVSPLQFAARKSSIENAEFMRFLLSAGADPEHVSRSRKPADEIGAKEIVRWLGMTWNELVEQTRDCRRGASAAPPDPSVGPRPWRAA
jgi:ankyrin repeat protein